ncbi:ParB/RepB/Spo0J family partition protein [Xenorhabdus doucetiae]|uniref:ParB domain protein nuclease n=1 Tax=Xenorhabdus doucetiae TaxID=351671 RepID=A0A068QWU8_9GAMM|nr:ParB/RepB/Spo0J family partition protein [Xenorhabdus doucetiae]TYP06733.1 ParB family chromosome partitioning protein [Xenorhabdus doucetiae]CDG18310.1 ParB domain protein nuclease [Xenorhabdus doucetiae]
MNQNSFNNHRIILVDIKSIKIANPRTRNKFIHNEIKENIEKTGLRKPVSLRKIKDGEFEYALICGQGRLEALINLGETKVPAIIKDVDEEDGYIMSLVENIARRNPRSAELFEVVRDMKLRGLTDSVISEHIGYSKDWVNNITMLLSKGEKKLLSAVENRKIPLYLAVEFARSNTAEAQHLFLNAYEKGLIKSKDVIKIRNILDQRSEGKKGSKNNEYIYNKGNKKISPEELVVLYQDNIDKHKSLHAKSEYISQNLVLIKQIIQELLQKKDFVSILITENMDYIPTLIIDSIKNEEELK